MICRKTSSSERRPDCSAVSVDVAVAEEAREVGDARRRAVGAHDVLARPHLRRPRPGRGASALASTSTSSPASAANEISSPDWCRVSSDGEPSAASRPPVMIATRSQSVSASSIACVVSSTVTPRVAQVAHELPRGRAGVRVHARGRLVEEHDVGPADERARERQSLRLAAREPAHRRAGRVAQPDEVEQRLGRLGRRRSTPRRGAGARAAAGPGTARPLGA